MNFHAFHSVENDRRGTGSVRLAGTGTETAGPRHLQLEIRGYVENVYLVRSLADQAAGTWGLSDDVREAARLILTELTTNATHASFRILAGDEPGPGGVPRHAPKVRLWPAWSGQGLGYGHQWWCPYSEARRMLSALTAGQNNPQG